MVLAISDGGTGLRSAINKLLIALQVVMSPLPCCIYSIHLKNFQ